MSKGELHIHGPREDVTIHDITMDEATDMLKQMPPTMAKFKLYVFGHANIEAMFDQMARDAIKAIRDSQANPSSPT